MPPRALAGKPLHAGLHPGRLAAGIANLARRLLATLYMLPRPPKSRHLLWAACLAFAPVPATDFQDLAQLESLARDAAQRVLPPLAEKQRLQVGPLAPNRQLGRCDIPVSAAPAPGIPIPGRVLIELRCAGRSPWHLYIPVKIIGTTAVVAAAHALVAGTQLTAKDLAVEQRDVIGLPPGYLDDPALAIGLTANRGIAGGAILTNQQLLGTQAIQRGQSVTLVATGGGISVRMAGRALCDGFVNQRVKVENLSSGKVVEGIARSAQLVEVVF